MTQKKDHSVCPTLPSLPQSGEEIYNHIMETIEPELTIPSVYSLEKKYKNETVAQRQERGHRYTEKFKKYWEVYEQSVSDITHSLSLYNRELYRYIEFLSREEDEQYLSSLEEVIHSQ